MVLFFYEPLIYDDNYRSIEYEGFDSINCTYSVNGNTEFYDSNMGNWRANFKKFES